MNPQRFRKRPVVIEAMQFDGSVQSYLAIWRWAGGVAGPVWADFQDRLVIRTLEGEMSADHGDWIIKGIRGEFYPCKRDIFAATYELLDGDTEKAGTE